MHHNEQFQQSEATQESERRWDELFARSPEVLERLAAEAMAEHDAGLTLPLDPESSCDDPESAPSEPFA